MRKYISYLMLAVAAAFFTGCIDVNVTPIEPQEPTMVTLQLRNADLVATRAITDDNLNNEDLIKSVQCFFAVAGSDAVVYATDLIPVNTQQTKTLSLAIPAESLSTLFANNATQCDVYVLANYGTKITDNSIATIKAKDITLGTGATQESFVMDGTAKVTLNGTALSATVNLYRAAAKIVVKANIKTPIVEGTASWIPQIDGIKMKYLGSVNGSKISATAANAVTTTKVTYEQTTTVFTKDEANSSTNKYVGYQAVPFYSFPVVQAANKGEIDMIIPWKMGDTNNIVEYKYQIPVDIALERNHVYLLEVNVEVLGLVDGAQLTPSYVVVNWAENAISTGLSRPKYLVVDETNVVMNNVNSYSVGYASSDDVTAVITSITKPNYTSNTATTTTIYSNSTGSTSVTPSNTISGNRNTFTLNNDTENKVLTLSHTLVNDNTSSSFDFVPYDITIKVTNQSGFTEIITVKQYPAVYVVNHLNNNGVLDNINNNNLDDNSYTKASGFGYVMVNTLYANRYDYNELGYYDNGNKWQSVEGFDRTSNNPNMYIVTTTALDATSAQKYILGDSRSATEQNASTVGFTSVTDVKGKTLTKYRATKTDREDYLSPQFRISSAYGQLGSNTLSADQAKYRCAAYQEDGYPAGRWRLATYAELSYIAMLCAKGALPESLFGASDYWSATGALKIDTDGGKVSKGNASSAYLRCVYDDWYWGNEQLKNKAEYTWGDQSTTAQLNQ